MDTKSVSPCSSRKGNVVNGLPDNHAPPSQCAGRLCYKARCRLGGPMDTILGQMINFNTLGVSETKNFRFSEALRYFTCGLRQLIRISTQAPSWRTPKSLLCSIQHSRIESLPSDHFSAPLLTKQFTETQDYDEGVNYFIDYLEDLDKSFNGCLGGETVASALLYNIGLVYVEQECYSDAQDCFMEAWSIMQEKLPAAHILRIHCLFNMGCGEYRLGNKARATKTFEKVDGLLNELLKTKTATFYSSIERLRAAVCNCLGVLSYHSSNADASEAMTYLTRARFIGRHTNVADLLSHATTLNNLGRANYKGCNYEQAVNSYEKALSIRRHILGESHVDVAATCCNLAQTLHRIGDLEGALEKYSEFLKITLPKFGPFHQDIAFALKCIACIHYERGEKVQALDNYKDILSCQIQCLGIHPEVAAIYSRMGKIYFDLGDYDAAIDMYTHGLRIELTVLQRNHPNVIITLSNIAQIYQLAGDLTTAMNVYKHVLSYQAKALGSCHADVAATLARMGLVNFQGGNFWYALDLHQEALRIRRLLFGEVSLEVAGSLNSVGLAFFNLSAYDDALESFVKCMQIREEILGHKNHDVAVALYNIAAARLELGDEDAALSCYRESLEIEKLTLGPVHKDVLLPLECIVDIYQRRGELSEALDHCSQILEILECGIPLDHAGMARTLNRMANLSIQLGKTGRAVKFIVDAARISQSYESANNVEIGLSGFDLYACAKLYPEGSAAA